LTLGRVDMSEKPARMCSIFGCQRSAQRTCRTCARLLCDECWCPHEVAAIPEAREPLTINREHFVAHEREQAAEAT